MKIEVLVRCPVCEEEIWVDWNMKDNSFCYNCCDKAGNSSPMIPLIRSQKPKAATMWYTTKEVEE